MSAVVVNLKLTPAQFALLNRALDSYETQQQYTAQESGPGKEARDARAEALLAADLLKLLRS